MPKATNDYTATATAEKRLREILAPVAAGELELNDIVEALSGAGVTIEIKPRLKSVQLIVPIPQPRPASKLGEFSPKADPGDWEDDVDLVV
jgi:hypothetical protein